jgi:hypothetical protein
MDLRRDDTRSWRRPIPRAYWPQASWRSWARSTGMGMDIIVRIRGKTMAIVALVIVAIAVITIDLTTSAIAMIRVTKIKNVVNS